MNDPKFFELEITVQHDHLDEMNHVNNVQYLQWVQDVAKAHWEQTAQPDWLIDYAWVVLSHNLEYKKPAFEGDVLVLKTHVHEVRGVKSHRLVRIFNKRNNNLLVQASTEWCLIKKSNMRPTRIPDEMIHPYFNS